MKMRKFYVFCLFLLPSARITFMAVKAVVPQEKETIFSSIIEAGDFQLGR